jgi:hypothetical protein
MEHVLLTKNVIIALFHMEGQGRMCKEFILTWTTFIDHTLPLVRKIRIAKISWGLRRDTVVTYRVLVLQVVSLNRGDLGQLVHPSPTLIITHSLPQ